jgi:hypothetical protein
MAYNYVVTVRLIAVEKPRRPRASPRARGSRDPRAREQIFHADEPYRRCADLSI